MGILSTILIGFVVGLVARAVIPGKDPLGIIMTTLLGIAGAMVGKFIGEFFHLYKEGQPAGFFMSLLGAIILLLVYNHFARKNLQP